MAAKKKTVPAWLRRSREKERKRLEAKKKAAAKQAAMKRAAERKAAKGKKPRLIAVIYIYEDR